MINLFKLLKGYQGMIDGCENFELAGCDSIVSDIIGMVLIGVCFGPYNYPGLLDSYQRLKICFFGSISIIE
jgi:hypothetical protein